MKDIKNKQSFIIRLKNFIIKRNTVQALATLFTNIHILNFFKANLYKGKIKSVCVPGLNCYSCPAATGACPIGSLQAVIGSSKYNFSFYVVGILIFFGSIFGRFICGFLCPFGWFQDLLHKIPSKKISTKKIYFLSYLKYLILLLFVFILPMIFVNSSNMGSPFFCKYICPVGILEGGIPLSIANKSIAHSLGKLFLLKLSILIIFILLSIIFYRPFCKWICPLGAFYSFFNKVSFIKYRVNENKCISCRKCSKICMMDVDITKNASSLECIRCGKCINICPTKAITIEKK